MYHFIDIREFKLELESGNAKLGWKSTICLAVWPWNLTDDLEKQQGTSSKQNQALCIVSSPYVNSIRSYDPETAKWGQDLCDPHLWPLTLTFCMDITSASANKSWKFQDDTMTGTLSKRCDGRTDGQTDGQTETSVLSAAWSQLKTTTDIHTITIANSLVLSWNLKVEYSGVLLLNIHLE